MTADNKIKDKKLQNNVNREAEKISALPSSKIDKYEYVAGEEVLLSDQNRVIEQATFTYSPLRKALENKQQLKIKGENKLKL